VFGEDYAASFGVLLGNIRGLAQLSRSPRIVKSLSQNPNRFGVKCPIAANVAKVPELLSKC
jgi:hypothetical protein